jgi:hypothetical protein
MNSNPSNYNPCLSTCGGSWFYSSQYADAASFRSYSYYLRKSFNGLGARLSRRCT